MQRLTWTTVATAALLSAGSLPAQDRGSEPLLPVRVTARLTSFQPGDGYAQACGHSSLGIGGEVRTRGGRYLAVFGEGFSEGIGDDVGCLGVTEGPEGRTYTLRGGLDPGGVARAGAGAGWSAVLGWIGVEAEARAGLVHGRPGWAAPGESTDRRSLPWAGYALGGSLLDHVVLRWEGGWTRLPFREALYVGPDPFAPGPPPHGEPTALRSTHRWRHFGGVSIGVRW